METLPLFQRQWLARRNIMCAIREKMESFKKNKTWELFPLPKEKKVIGSK